MPSFDVQVRALRTRTPDPGRDQRVDQGRGEVVAPGHHQLAVGSDDVFGDVRA